MLLAFLALPGSLRRARRMTDRLCFLSFCSQPRRDIGGRYCAIHMRCSWCSTRDRVGVYATCSTCFALTKPQGLLPPVGRALTGVTRRASAAFVADAVTRLLGRSPPSCWLSSIISEFLGERQCMWYWLTALAAGRASTSQTSYMERLHAAHVRSQPTLGSIDWVHDSWDTRAPHTLIAPMFVFFCAFPNTHSPVSYPSEVTLTGWHNRLLLRSSPNTTNHTYWPDYGNPPDPGGLRMLTPRDINSAHVTRSVNPCILYGARALPEDLALIRDLCLPLAQWSDDTISTEENTWTFAPPLREYFEYSTRDDFDTPTVMSVMHAGLRGAHVCLHVPEGGGNWPSGPVHVFFQSSRNLQVSIWSEAFAVLIDSLIFAFYRLLHSSHAQDFDIALGHLLPEATGLRLQLRNCSLFPNPRDGWCPVTPLPVPCAAPGDATTPGSTTTWTCTRSSWWTHLHASVHCTCSLYRWAWRSSANPRLACSDWTGWWPNSFRMLSAAPHVPTTVASSPSSLCSAGLSVTRGTTLGVFMGRVSTWTFSIFHGSPVPSPTTPLGDTLVHAFFWCRTCTPTPSRRPLHPPVPPVANTARSAVFSSAFSTSLTSICLGWSLPCQSVTAP